MRSRRGRLREAPGAEDLRLAESLGTVVASLPPRRPSFAGMPSLPTELEEALGRLGVSALYSHQREAYDGLLRGENVIVSTATASGKSLCYEIPAFENALTDPSSRALFLYPTKALAQDQLGKIEEFALRGVRAATYDGDTPQALRADVRRRANIVLTNPDMLSVGILPHHDGWGHFFRNLRLVAVDEAHVLRGVFGSHAAMVLRRLRRVAALHGADPRFVFTSATVANPQELAESLTGLPFSLVDEDGASSGGRRVVFRNPPLLDESRGERRSLLVEGALVFAELVSRGVRTIAFARTRRGAELVYRYAANRLGIETARRISPYRAGYTARERREIEGRLFRGELLGVVSTNALELGVDVGELDAVVCCGYPGSIASIWQQWGRAGRGERPALSVYIAGRDALDQFIFENPKRVLGRRVEAARVTVENSYILAPHLLAAAHESPLEESDEEFFGPAFRRVAGELAEEGALRRSGGRLLYTGGGHPARDISLRSASAERVAVVDADGEVIGSSEATRAPGELHPGATYLHRGRAYEVEELDLAARRAVVRRVPDRYYTRPRVETDVEVIEEAGSRPLANGATLHRGRVRTSERVTHYKKVRVADDREVGVYPLDLPEVVLETQAFWVTLPPPPEGARPSFERFGGALHAAEHGMIGLLPLFAMCDRADLGGLSTPVHRQTYLPTIFVYDGYPGGVGISERGYEAFASLARDTLGVIVRCPCERGCPACIQSPKCGNWNEPLNKEGAVALLRYLLGQIDQHPAL